MDIVRLEFWNERVDNCSCSDSVGKVNMVNRDWTGQCLKNHNKEVFIELLPYFKFHIHVGGTLDDVY